MRAPKILLVSLAMLVIPGAARAADWYAAPSPAGSDANTCAAGSPCATIGHVVDLAGVHDGDTVHLAAGTYDENVLTSKRLTFAGAGAGTPTSAAGSSFIHSPGTFNALNLSGGGTVQDIRLRGNDGAGVATGALTFNSLGGTALAYTLRRVVAIGGHDPGTNASMLAVWITAQNAGSTLSANVQDVYVASTGLVGVALQVQDATGGHGTATVTRATLVPGMDGTGLETDLGATVSMADSSVQAATGSRAISANGPFSLVRSNVNGGNDGLIWTGPSPLSIIDSLITAAPTTSSREALDLDAVGPGTSSVLVKGSTLAVKSSDASHRVIAVNSQAGNTTNVQFVNSIARLRQADGSAAPGSELRTFLTGGLGTINFTASHSSFSTVLADAGTTLPAPGSGTNVAGDPGFVSWTGANYALAPSSPLIDRGDPAAVTAGELDLVHTPRSLDGNADCLPRPDVGAYELTGHAGVPPTPTVSGPALARAGQAVTFTATPATGFTLGWTFSGGGTASGASVSHAFTAGGTQSATVTATHLGCVGKATRTIVIDATAPKLSSLSVKKKKLRFKLTEAASVKVTVLVRKPHSHKYKSLGSFTLKGKKGSNSAKLPKKVHGHKLKAGAYEVKLRATDPAGNRSRTKTKTFTL